MIKIIIISFIVLFSQVGIAQINQNDPDLIQTQSGLKYKITKQGAGNFPKSGDRVWVHYYAKFLNDSIYDSTVDKGPIDVRLGHGQLIKGWEEGLKLLKPGGAMLLIVPPELGYGDKVQENIPPNSTLVFEIALLQVNSGSAIKPFNTEGVVEQKGKKKLRYYVIKDGEGPNAKFGDNAYIHFTGYLPDSTIFDSSHKNGKPVRITVGLNQVVEGLDMGLLFMKKGSKIRLKIPSKIAYGKEGLNNIVPPNSKITLDLEMVDLIPPDPVKMWDVSGKQIIETASGLKYIVVRQGDNVEINNNEMVVVHYSGYFANGKIFDSSVKRFEPLKFPVGAGVVIDGWDEGVKLMTKGAKFQFIVPSNLGYGKDGAPPAIPPNTDLIFDIEVLDVIK